LCSWCWGFFPSLYRNLSSAPLCWQLTLSLPPQNNSVSTDDAAHLHGPPIPSPIVEVLAQSRVQTRNQKKRGGRERTSPPRAYWWSLSGGIKEALLAQHEVDCLMTYFCNISVWESYGMPFWYCSSWGYLIGIRGSRWVLLPSVY
jgi:hypothetical protein